MAVSNVSFGAQVEAWVRQTQARMEAVFRESAQRVVSRAQSRIPIDTGFARASIRASLSAMPQIDPNSTNKTRAPVAYDSGQISLVIAQAKLGQTIYVGWTANYAQYLENGHSKQAPIGFVRVSAMEWPQIVAEVTDDRLRRALLELGHEPGETEQGNTALKVARQALHLVSLALIAAGVRKHG